LQLEETSAEARWNAIMQRRPRNSPFNAIASVGARIRQFDDSRVKAPPLIA
jgi:hypothetical protein